MHKLSQTRGFFLKAKSYKLKAAFTLVEMLVAVGIFAVIMVIAVGSLVSLIEANHKAQTQKTVVNNLHFALENMSRNIRTGFNYHCGGSGIEDPQSCPDERTSESQFVFKSNQGVFVMYRMNNGAIERSQNVDPVALVEEQDKFIPLTSSEITLEQLRFYVDGAEQGDSKQPRVLIVAKGSLKGKSKVTSRFDIQTLVSQRLLDVEE